MYVLNTVTTSLQTGEIPLPKILRNAKFNVSPDMSRKTKFYTQKEKEAYRVMKVKMDTIVDRVYNTNTINNVRKHEKENFETITINKSSGPYKNHNIQEENKSNIKFFNFVNLSKELGKINAYEGSKFRTRNNSQFYLK